VTNFFPSPYLECNFFYLTEMEMNQFATADQSYMFKEVSYVGAEGQFGPNTDLLLPMRNLVSRVTWVVSRSDSIANNMWDNYTNWPNPDRAPWTVNTLDVPTSLYASGQNQVTSVFPRESVVDGVILFDGNERLQVKPVEYYSLIQTYRFADGTAPLQLPGVYMYSFGLNNSEYQPSGAANGSTINKAVLRLTLLQPLPAPNQPSAPTTTTVCILKSTALSTNPLVIPAAQIGLYTPDQILSVVQNVNTTGNSTVVFQYTYTVGAYVESYNYLRVVSGLANLVFAS
jgi:hypothetical protein